MILVFIALAIAAYKLLTHRAPADPVAARLVARPEPLTFVHTDPLTAWSVDFNRPAPPKSVKRNPLDMYR